VGWDDRGLPPGTKVFPSCQPIDLRDGLDGLAAKVRQITKPIALTDFSDRFAENQVKTLLSAA
jgi:hypothetical protein